MALIAPEPPMCAFAKACNSRITPAVSNFNSQNVPTAHNQCRIMEAYKCAMKAPVLCRPHPSYSFTPKVCMPSSDIVADLQLAKNRAAPFPSQACQAHCEEHQVHSEELAEQSKEKEPDSDENHKNAHLPQSTPEETVSMPITSDKAEQDPLLHWIHVKTYATHPH